MSEKKFGVQGICAIVPAKDMGRSIAFYEKLGFTCQLWEDGSSYAFLNLDGLQIHLTHAEDFTGNPGGLYIYVDDVDAFYERIVANGVKTLDKPEDRIWRCREFCLSDPDELLIRIGSLMDRN